MSDGGDCRTTPATPGLLKSVYMFCKCYNNNKKYNTGTPVKYSLFS